MNTLINVILYYIFPSCIFVIGRYRKWNDSIYLIILKLLLFFIFSTWFISFWSYYAFDDSFKPENFSIIYPSCSILFSYFLGFILNFHAKTYRTHIKLMLQYQSKKVTKLNTFETIVFCIILSFLIAFMKDVFELSGQIYMRELMLMFKQADAYKGNTYIIFSYLSHFSLTLFAPSFVIIVLYYYLSQGIIVIDLSFCGHDNERTIIYFRADFRALTIIYLLSFLFISKNVIRSEPDTYHSWLEENAIVPNINLLEFPAKKRNILHIELESFETSYASQKNGGLFNTSKMPHLEALALDPQNLHFTHLGEGTIGGPRTIPLTRFTTSAIFASICGVPFMGDIFIHEAQNSNLQMYLSKHKCISDLLREAGYGTSATFGSMKNDWQKGDVFELHNFEYINSYEVRKWQPDSEMFEIFKKQINVHENNGKPWYAFALTVDTHEPGIICDDCPEDTEIPYRTARCSDNRLYNLIQWCKTQKWYNNTLIVIHTDHVSRHKCLKNLASQLNIERRAFNLMINAIHNEVNHTYREYSSFDLYPTILSAAGIKVKGDKLGVGINLFSSQKTFLERMGSNDFEYELQATTTWYNTHYLGMDNTCTGNAPCITGKLSIGDWMKKIE